MFENVHRFGPLHLVAVVGFRKVLQSVRSQCIRPTAIYDN